MLYDGDKTLEGKIIESLEPAIEREIRWLSKKSGHRMGRKSTLQIEKDLFLSRQQGRCSFVHYISVSTICN